MTGTLLSLVITIALGINLSVHGAGAWGLQPGGRFASLLFGIQILVSLSGLLWLLIHTNRVRSRTSFYMMGCSTALAILAGITFMTTGWRIATSIHNQSSENLIPFFLATSVAISAWGYKVWVDHGMYRAKLIGE